MTTTTGGYSNVNMSIADPKKLAISFKEQLDNLGCPMTDDVDESWILDLLFRPGEPRIRLLQWLLCKFDSNLSDTLDPHLAASDSKMDSRIQRLLFVTSTLGLCKQEDADLIRGSASASRQAAFLERLINMVGIVEKAEDPRTRHLVSPGMVSQSQTLEEQVDHACRYVDTLASEGRIDSMFSTQAKLLPPDIMKRIYMKWEDQGCTDMQSPPAPDLSKLADTVTSLAEDLGRQQEILTELKKQFDYQARDDKELENITKKLQLALSETAQLVVGFTYCYENEMKQWCNKTAPQLGDFGPAVKRVHNLLHRFTEFLRGLATIRTSSTTICTSVKDDTTAINKRMPKSQLTAVSQSATENFQECISVLETSLSRLEETASTNNTMSSTVLGLEDISV